MFIKKIVILSIIFLLFYAGGAAARLADSPWPTFHGNLQRTGLSSYNTSHIDGTIKWRFETDGGIESAPSIDTDGVIYVGSHDGYLYAINPDGTEKWKTKVGTPKKKEYGGTTDYTSVISSPTIAEDGTIYIASRDQYLFAISSDGKEKWRFPISLSFDASVAPAVGEDGTIYVVSSLPRAGVIAINPDGTEKWYYGTKSNSFNSPAIGKDGTIYVALMLTTQSNAIIALNPDGTEKWKVMTKLQLESSPSIADDGTVYVGSFNPDPSGAGIYAVSPEGKIKWHFPTEAKEIMTTPAIGPDGTIYFGTDKMDPANAAFYAIHPNGTLKWRFPTKALVETHPAVGQEGTIYFGVTRAPSNIPAFYALNPDGTVKWTYSFKGTTSFAGSPAIAKDGTIYAGSWDKRLYAFGSKDLNILVSGSEGGYVALIVTVVIVVVIIILAVVLMKRRK